MNYNEKISEKKNELSELENKKLVFQNILKELKIGDKVYEQQCRYLDYDYHPQIIKEIDIDNCRVLVYEESINVEKWITSFHLYDENFKNYIYYY